MHNTHRLTRLVPKRQLVPTRTTSIQAMQEESCGDPNIKKGLVLGVYNKKAAGEYELSNLAKKMDVELGGRLTQLVKKVTPRVGQAVVLNNLGEQFFGIAIAAAGEEGLGYNEAEVLNECKENIRIAAGAGARALQDMGVGDIVVDSFTNAEAAAEGSQLAVWKYQEFRNPIKKTQESIVRLKRDDTDKEGWTKGKIKAQGQNIARALAEAPANEMTSWKFAQRAMEILCPVGVSVDVRDRDWMEQKNFTSFIAVGKPSCEQPLILEICYNGADEGSQPVSFVGVGHTFDSGGLCLKKCKNMGEHRADMAGAAVVVGLLKSVALMNLPISIRALIPLSENMPGGMVVKPGDVVHAINGKTVRIEDTSRQARVQVADALNYTSQYNPCLVVNIGTMSRGVIPSLGECPSAVFSSSDSLWNELKIAGAESGDRVWRMPLWQYYCKRITEHTGVDVNNVGHAGGDTCIGAAFLMNFVPKADFASFDISATGKLSSGYGFPYLRKGLMTGRPTRTLAQFVEQLACPSDRPSPC